MSDWKQLYKDAQGELVRIRAGEDRTPPPEGTRHTAAQMWCKLLDSSTNDRLRVLNLLLEDSNTLHSLMNMCLHEDLGRGLDGSTRCIRCGKLLGAFDQLETSGNWADPGRLPERDVLKYGEDQ